MNDSTGGATHRISGGWHVGGTLDCLEQLGQGRSAPFDGGVRFPSRAVGPICRVRRRGGSRRRRQASEQLLAAASIVGGLRLLP